MFTCRQSHIPDGPGYQEKFYFTPGDSGFKVWKTRFGTIGVGICWDQWFPEAARSMALMGADIILYPTAIGTEPQDATIDSADHWQRVMQGHAAANVSTPRVSASCLTLSVMGMLMSSNFLHCRWFPLLQAIDLARRYCFMMMVQSASGLHSTAEALLLMKQAESLLKHGLASYLFLS